MRFASVAELKNGLSAYLERARKRNEPVVVTRHTIGQRNRQRDAIGSLRRRLHASSSTRISFRRCIRR
jgi:hypothetical protein